MLELLDTILGAISFFDLITPIAGLTQNLVRGSSFTFRIPHRAGWGIYSVERILKEAGCDPVWGKQIFMDTMMLTVKEEDAQRGYWALRNADVPMENDIPKGTSKPKQGPKRKSSFLGDLGEFFDW